MQTSIRRAPNPIGAPSSVCERDYARIAQAIEYLQQHAEDQPDLAAIARHLHLSEYHFQRLFTRWAGVSPKRFLQFLTVEHAKTRLIQARNILDLTADVGLSGPGRLHDLFVTLEAASPGEIRTGGVGLRISFGIHESPFGPCLIGATPRGICAMQFLDSANRDDAAMLLRRLWPNAELEFDPHAVAPLARQVFDPLSTTIRDPLSVLVKGSNFQMQVWRALLQVPLGHVTTYHDIAGRLGRPSAARAVGNAVGRNPIAYLIPCHRVIRESGGLGGYRWGRPRKAALLGWEAARILPAERGP